MKKKLPVGVQDFSTLIEGDFLYVDKTEQIFQLVQSGTGDFLSRPRRFGKSLLVSCLEAIFLGKRSLFKGLWIDQAPYEWPTFPVIFLDFSRVIANSVEECRFSLNELLREVAEQYQVPLEPTDLPSLSLSRLIKAMAKKGRVVILVDEYDRPLLKNVEKGPLLVDIRDEMQDFFVVLKALGKHLRYVFVTGVSKFSKVSLFSGMNHLRDISLDPHYATLTGITEAEMESYYQEYISHVAESRQEDVGTLRNKIRKWYNGYSFSGLKGMPKVYNPVSLHLFFDQMRFGNFWFGTATPTFAIQLIKKQNFPVIDFENGVEMGASLEEHHEVLEPNLIPLLFQTGYLTITDYDEDQRKYRLCYPNEEVRLSLLDHLMTGLTTLDESRLGVHFKYLGISLKEGNFEEFFSSMNALLAEIPYPIHMAQEAYYHSLFYLVVRSLGLRVEAETMTNRGRMDLVVSLDGSVLIFEFKIGGTAQAALDQIASKGYADRYQKGNKKVILIGVNFNAEKRTIDDWVVD